MPKSPALPQPPPFLLARLKELHARQRDGRPLDPDTVQGVAREWGVPEAQVQSALTFFPAFAPTGSGRPNWHTALGRRLEQELKAAPELPQGRIGPKRDGETRRVLDRIPVKGEVASLYGGLAYARTLSSDEILATLECSGLRGCGGAGFSTAMKWRTAAATEADERYIVCNAAEGDLGAFMDRALLEQDPHRVIEGMAIAGRAVGAARGYIYLREEYAELGPRLEQALVEAREQGVMGDGFDISVFEAAGMYVCGEETALLNSMEGKAGRPRSRPPFPAQAGLWGRPTVVNNVKTLAHVAWIFAQGARGAEEFAALGTDRSKGTAILAVSGNIARPGVLEVPMGTPLRQVLEQAGGMAGGRALKAVQTGGPLGGLLPAAALDTPVSFEHFAERGAPLGSGGLIFLDDSRCMARVARLFTEFAQAESCGHCAPCRLGTTQALSVLQRLTSAATTTKSATAPDPLALLASLRSTTRASSFCAFGQASLQVAACALEHFRNDFEHHDRCTACKESRNG